MSPLLRWNRALGIFYWRQGIGTLFAAQKNKRQDESERPGKSFNFSPGPLGGIPQFPGTSKCMAISLSPLTHIPGVSNFGGHFGAYLKYAGFDALEITGIGEENTMIVIDGSRMKYPSPKLRRWLRYSIWRRPSSISFLQAGHDKKISSS